METPLQKLPFDEALYQTFNFVSKMSESMDATFTDDERAAVKITSRILAQMVVEMHDDTLAVPSKL